MIAFATSGGTDPPFLATWLMDYFGWCLSLHQLKYKMLVRVIQITTRQARAEENA